MVIILWLDFTVGNVKYYVTDWAYLRCETRFVINENYGRYLVRNMDVTSYKYVSVYEKIRKLESRYRFIP